MKYLSVWWILILFFFYGRTLAQHLPQAHKIVHQLSSRTMKGRGYVGNGCGKSATYLQRKFTKLGLRSFSPHYLQPLSTPVNTFPTKVKLKIGGRKQVAGRDFLVDAGSPSSSGSYETVLITRKEELLQDSFFSFLQEKCKQKMLLIVLLHDKAVRSASTPEEQERLDLMFDFLRTSPLNPSAGTIFFTNEKLTWTTSTVQYTKPTFWVRYDSSFSPRSMQYVKTDVEALFIPNYPIQNVLGYIEGSGCKDSFLVVSAHYDHLGMMGKGIIFPGANDNASGIALLLRLASYYTEHPPKYTLVFMAFSGEEIGLVGSRYFVDHPLFQLDRIKFLINFDMVGTGEKGIQIVNGSVYEKQFQQIVQLNEEGKYLPQVNVRGSACNSDHCAFDSQKVPCFFIYTLGGISAYHDRYDRARTLPLTAFNDLLRLTTKFYDLW